MAFLIWIFRNSPSGAEHSSSCLRFASVSPRVRCAGIFPKWFDPSDPVVPVFLWRVAAFNLAWRGGVACVAIVWPPLPGRGRRRDSRGDLTVGTASGPWPSERRSGCPRGSFFRSRCLATAPRILQVREWLLDGRRERDEVVQGVCELQVEGHGERQGSDEAGGGAAADMCGGQLRAERG